MKAVRPFGQAGGYSNKMGKELDQYVNRKKGGKSKSSGSFEVKARLK